MSYAYKTIDSPAGTLKLVASEKGLAALLFRDDDPSLAPLQPLVEQPNHPILLETERQLAPILRGARKTFSVPLDFNGTEFQKRVWEALLTIPVRRNAQLRRHRAAARQSDGLSGRRRGEWQKSNIDHCTLPPRDRLEWKAHRVRRWSRREGDASCVGSNGNYRVGRAGSIGSCRRVTREDDAITQLPTFGERHSRFRTVRKKSLASAENCRIDLNRFVDEAERGQLMNDGRAPVDQDVAIAFRLEALAAATSPFQIVVGPQLTPLWRTRRRKEDRARHRDQLAVPQQRSRGRRKPPPPPM